MPRASTRLRASSLLIATAFAWLTSAPFATARPVSSQPAPAGPDESPLVACAAPAPPIVTGLVNTEPAAPVPLAPSPSTSKLVQSQPPRPAMKEPASTRGLVPLFASYALMQALDVHSTLTAIDKGAVEENSLMAPLVRRPAAFVAVKAAMTAGTIVAAHRLARNNRVAAYALMVGLNSAYAYVVMHNYRVAANGR